MNFRTVSFVVCGAIALFTVFIAFRDPSKPTVDNDSAAFSQSTNRDIETAGPRGANQTATTQATLTNQEQVLLTELQENYTPAELDRLFNPPTTIELEQSIGERLNQPFDAYAYASRKYDEDGWSQLMDDIGLTPDESRRVRDAWVQLEAAKSELYDMITQGLVDPLAASDEIGEAESNFLSRIAGIFSSEQLAELENHERLLLAENAAQVQAEYQGMIDGGYTGIVVAASRGDLASVQAYLDSGADPNQMTTDGETALHNAAWYNETEIMRILINAGADVNLTIPGGNSALRRAARWGHVEAVELLIAAGADVNYYKVPNPVSTALTAAARSGSTDTVRALLEAGADATGPAGRASLGEAVTQGNRDMEQLLLESGAEDNGSVAAARALRELGRRLGLVND